MGERGGGRSVRVVLGGVGERGGGRSARVVLGGAMA